MSKSASQQVAWHKLWLNSSGVETLQQTVLVTQLVVPILRAAPLKRNRGRMHLNVKWLQRRRKPHRDVLFLFVWCLHCSHFHSDASVLLVHHDLFAELVSIMLCHTFCSTIPLQPNVNFWGFGDLDNLVFTPLQKKNIYKGFSCLFYDRKKNVTEDLIQVWCE